MDKNYLVTKSNYFIMNSSYDLSLEEQKIILTLASMVQPEDAEFKPYNFRISDFMELLGIETQTKYTEVPKITKNLMKKVFEIKEGKATLQVAWLSSVRYEKGAGEVTLCFDPNLKPYMLQLKERFTQYQLANILTMKSKYSTRIYEILKCNEFKKQGNIEIEVEELRKLLKAENTYPLYADFKRFIIKQAEKEINKLTDISFEFKEIKTGRKVTALKFIIHSKNVKKNKSVAPDEAVPGQVNFDTYDEISAAAEGREPYDTKVSQVKDILSKHNISDLEAKKILAAAKDIEQIKQKYKIIKNLELKSVVGAMIKALKEDWQEPKNNKKKNRFNNFPQTKYNFAEIERMEQERTLKEIKEMGLE